MSDEPSVQCVRCRDTGVIPGSIPALDQRCDCVSVAVAGDVMTWTLAQFEARALLLLGEEQRKPNPDNGLIAFLCEAVRLKREHCRPAQWRMGGNCEQH